MTRRRRGVSLTELLVVMTACTVVLTLTSQLICRVMRIQIESRAHCDVERNSMRLSEQFRSDVHRAEGAITDRTAIGKDVFLRLEFPGGEQAEYSRHEGTIVRQVLREAKLVAREEFEFPPAGRLTIENVGAPPRLLLTFATSLSPIPAGNSKPLVVVPTTPVSLQVEALIGRDVRFAANLPGEEAVE